VITVEVRLRDRSYPVLVGAGVVGELAGVLRPAAARAAIVTQAGIGLEGDPGREHRTFVLIHGIDSAEHEPHHKPEYKP